MFRVIFASSLLLLLISGLIQSPQNRAGGGRGGPRCCAVDLLSVERTRFPERSRQMLGHESCSSAARARGRHASVIGAGSISYPNEPQEGRGPREQCAGPWLNEGVASTTTTRMGQP